MAAGNKVQMDRTEQTKLFLVNIKRSSFCLSSNNLFFTLYLFPLFAVISPHPPRWFGSLSNKICMRYSYELARRKAVSDYQIIKLSQSQSTQGRTVIFLICFLALEHKQTEYGCFTVLTAKQGLNMELQTVFGLPQRCVDKYLLRLRWLKPFLEIMCGRYFSVQLISKNFRKQTYSSSKISIQSVLETALETTLTLKLRTRSLITEAPIF